MLPVHDVGSGAQQSDVVLEVRLDVLRVYLGVQIQIFIDKTIELYTILNKYLFIELYEFLIRIELYEFLSLKQVFF